MGSWQRGAPSVPFDVFPAAGLRVSVSGLRAHRSASLGPRVSTGGRKERPQSVFAFPPRACVGARRAGRTGTAAGSSWTSLQDEFVPTRGEPCQPGTRSGLRARQPRRAAGTANLPHAVPGRRQAGGSAATHGDPDTLPPPGTPARGFHEDTDPGGPEDGCSPASWTCQESPCCPCSVGKGLHHPGPLPRQRPSTPHPSTGSLASWEEQRVQRGQPGALQKHPAEESRCWRSSVRSRDAADTEQGEDTPSRLMHGNTRRPTCWVEGEPSPSRLGLSMPLLPSCPRHPPAFPSLLPGAAPLLPPTQRGWSISQRALCRTQPWRPRAPSPAATRDVPPLPRCSRPFPSSQGAPSRLRGLVNLLQATVPCIGPAGAGACGHRGVRGDGFALGRAGAHSAHAPGVPAPALAEVVGREVRRAGGRHPSDPHGPQPRRRGLGAAPSAAALAHGVPTPGVPGDARRCWQSASAGLGFNLT
ncbi:uncharacterized protein [Nyctibius grandis]|uniref:uncharacterized protein n=1 Tax=Nyctibius grandis TaxID=48427 RepID=UPI0035BC0BAC